MKGRFGSHIAVVCTVVAMGIMAATSGASAATHPQRVHSGGALNIVAVTSQWPGLDPATDTQDAADYAYLSAIFGELIELQPGGTILPDEVSSWAYSNHNATLTLTIRKGVHFTDGNPLTAAVVAWSINRDLEPQFGNIGDVNFPLTPQGAYAVGNKVVMNTLEADTGLAYAFVNEAPNYTVDETALNSMGETAYAQKPVGAGPFEVVSNSASASLVVTKNTGYWQKGHPLLNSISWTNVGTDQSAISALQTGEDELATGTTTIPLIDQAPSEGITVTKLPQTVDEFITMNTEHAPFNNILAREAVEYATDSSVLVNNLYPGSGYKLIQSETAPGQHTYVKTNKYYLGYNLQKAQALVQQVAATSPGGKFTVDLSTTTNSAFWINEVQAIATMWGDAGINVVIQDYSLQQMLGITFSGAWQAIDENWGPSVDPTINDGQFFKGGAVFSGVNDPTLNGLLNQSAGYNNPVKLAQVYGKIANLMNQQVYAVWMYAKNAFDLSTKALVPNGGLAHTLLFVQWENLALK
jgi:peptide/nickel transport system substrate-binding protein